MADFKPIVEKTFKFEGGFQNSASDSANYCKGTLIGTNRGISAIGYAGYLGRCPTVAEIKAITPEIAENVYKKNYWNPVQGDTIKSQSVAHIMFDSHIASGGEGIKRIKNAINAVAKKIVFSNINSSAITAEQANEINALNPKDVFDKIHAGEVANRKRLAEINPDKYEKFLKGWLSRLNQITYSSVDVLKKNKGKILIFFLAAGIIGGSLIYFNQGKK